MNTDLKKALNKIKNLVEENARLFNELEGRQKDKSVKRKSLK